MLKLNLFVLSYQPHTRRLQWHAFSIPGWKDRRHVLIMVQGKNHVRNADFDLTEMQEKHRTQKSKLIYSHWKYKVRGIHFYNSFLSYTFNDCSVITLMNFLRLINFVIMKVRWSEIAINLNKTENDVCLLLC